MKMDTFVAATNNQGKLIEIEEVLASIGYTAISLKEAGIVCDPEENGKTFFENAEIKAKAVKALTGYAVVADDSGLMVEALGGLPGVHTARYAGDECDHDKNIEKLLKNLEGLPENDRRAWFVSVVFAILPNGEEISATGYAEGYIGYERRGEGGFGYDPVFYTVGNRSFSELSETRKNAISHRGRALRKLGFKLRNIKRIRGNE